MVKTSLKNFFTSIIYIFVPMGIIYLFVLLALFGFALSAVGSATTMFQELSALVSDTVTESEISISEFIVYAGEKLTWDGNIFNYIKQMVDTNWVQTTVREFFELLGGSSENFTASFSDIVTDFTDAVKLQLAIAIVTCYLGLLLANYATGFVVRRKNARRGLKRWIVANTVIPIVESLVLGGVVALVAEIQYYALLVFIVILLAYAFLALTSSWIVYGNKTLKFKDVVNTKNLLGQIASVAVIFLFVLVAFFLVLFVNFILAVLIALPAIVYALNIVKVNSDSYVMSLAAKKSAQGETSETKK